MVVGLQVRVGVRVRARAGVCDWSRSESGSEGRVKIRGGGSFSLIVRVGCQGWYSGPGLCVGVGLGRIGSASRSCFCSVGPSLGPGSESVDGGPVQDYDPRSGSGSRSGLRSGKEVRLRSRWKLGRGPGAEGGVGVGLSRGPSKVGGQGRAVVRFEVEADPKVGLRVQARAGAEWVSPGESTVSRSMSKSGSKGPSEGRSQSVTIEVGVVGG